MEGKHESVSTASLARYISSQEEKTQVWVIIMMLRSSAVPSFLALAATEGGLLLTEHNLSHLGHVHFGYIMREKFIIWSNLFKSLRLSSFNFFLSAPTLLLSSCRVNII